jgi:hypothetical protein
MSWLRPKRRGLKIVRIAIILAAILLGIAFLPFGVEGIYAAGRLSQCLCDSQHYIRLHNGKMALYDSNHPPASLFWRYETNLDGSVNVFLTPSNRSAPETLILTIKRPRLGFSVATVHSDGQEYLLLRLPNLGAPARTVADQTVEEVTLQGDGALVTSFYDSNFNKVRQETTELQKPRAEQVGAQNP